MFKTGSCAEGTCGICSTCDPLFVPPIVDDTESYARFLFSSLKDDAWLRELRARLAVVGCKAEVGTADCGEVLTVYGPRTSMARICAKLLARAA